MQADDGDGGEQGLPTSPTGRVPQWVLDEHERAGLRPAGATDAGARRPVPRAAGRTAGRVVRG